MAVFMSRTFEPPEFVVAVTITGTGGMGYAEVTIDGTRYTSAATGIEVEKGDVITFGIEGYSGSYPATLTIDGTQVAKSTGTSVTYEYTVPGGISEITIALYKNTGSIQYGTITVTTTS